MEADSRQLVAASKPADRPEAKAAKPRPAPRARPRRRPTLNAHALVNNSREMASLRATIDNRMQAYASGPKRKWITARTREHRFAAYMDAWRIKVERIGNLNYPEDARRRGLSGNLLLDVALNSDGTIHDIVLRRSSGTKILDDAAIRIVRLAAPYGRFPRSIAKDVDVLHIERTWQFSSNNRFASR